MDAPKLRSLGSACHRQDIGLTGLSERFRDSRSRSSRVVSPIANRHRQSGCDGCAAVRKCAAGRDGTTCDGCNHYLHVVCIGRPIPPVNPVADFTAAIVLPIDRPSSVLSALRPMATPGTVPITTASGSAARRCPLCAGELSLRSDGGGGSSSCPNCGFDVGQLGAARRKPEPIDAKPAPTALDPLDRWLAGESIEPKELTDRERFANWLRRHPRTDRHWWSSSCWRRSWCRSVRSMAYQRSAEDFRQAKLERTAAEQKQLDLSTAVAAKADELKVRDTRLEQEAARAAGARAKSLEDLHVEYEQSRQQCLAAEARLKEEVRAARLAMAEDFTHRGPNVATGNAGDEPGAGGQGALDHATRRDAADPQGVATGPRSACARPTASSCAGTTVRWHNWPPVATAAGSPAATMKA